jgi:hypothetical protein
VAARPGDRPWPAFLPVLGSIWYTEKRNAATTTATRTCPPATRETQTPAQGGRAMSTLFLNSPAGHASRAFVAQKTARHDQVPLLVGNHYLAETETLHQQASGAKNQKNSEQNAHYLLTILSRRTTRASSKQPALKKTVSKMLTILSRREREARASSKHVKNPTIERQAPPLPYTGYAFFVVIVNAPHSPVKIWPCTETLFPSPILFSVIRPSAMMRELILTGTSV